MGSKSRSTEDCRFAFDLEEFEEFPVEMHLHLCSKHACCTFEKIYLDLSDTIRIGSNEKNLIKFNSLAGNAVLPAEVQI